LFTEGFGWKLDEVEQMLPVDAIGQSYAMNQLLQLQAAKGKGEGGKEGKKENPQNMPQPQDETAAMQSAMGQFTPDVGAIG